MRNIFRIIGVSLASMAGLLLVSGTAWAQATETPVSGEVEIGVLTDPGEFWVDEDGVRHRRNARFRFPFLGDISGQQFKISRVNSNPETGERDENGSFTFVGFVLGDRVKAKGRYMSFCTGGDPNFCEETGIWHLEDGRKISLLETWIRFSGDPSFYEGILLDAPGRR